MAMYLVSVLVPVYNVEKYIVRCAKSLFMQTYPNLEYVFVDDCSKDESIALLSRVVEDYPQRKQFVRIVHHNTNRGLAAARNTSLDYAQGEFVCAVDSDDWLEIDAIEKLTKRQIETGADIVAGNMIMHASGGEIPFIEKKCNSKEELVLLQLQKTWDHTVCRKLIRRALYNDNNIRCLEGCDMTEDRYQMAQLAYFSSHYELIDDVVYHYERRNANSIMSKSRQKGALEKNYQYLKNWIGIRAFFADKESVFFEAANEKTLQFADYYRRLVLKSNDRERYYRIVSFLDNEDSKNQSIIGWTNQGIKGLIFHNYVLAEFTYQIKRVVRFFKKQMFE